MFIVFMKLNFFFIKDEEQLEPYNKIRNRVSNSMKKGFDSEPLLNKKYLKTKEKSYYSKINTNLYKHFGRVYKCCERD